MNASTGIRLLGKKIMLEEEIFWMQTCSSPTPTWIIFRDCHFLHRFTISSNVRMNAGHLADDNYDLPGNYWHYADEGSGFPVPSALIEKACQFNDYDCGKVFNLPGEVVIKTAPLNHPNGACGCKLNLTERWLQSVQILKHFEGRIDENVIELSQDADVMVYDSAYTDEEYPNFKGLGAFNLAGNVKVAEAVVYPKPFFHRPIS